MTGNSQVTEPTRHNSSAGLPKIESLRSGATRRPKRGIATNTSSQMLNPQESNFAGGRRRRFPTLTARDCRRNNTEPSRLSKLIAHSQDAWRFIWRTWITASLRSVDPELRETLQRWLPWLWLKGVSTDDAREILKAVAGPDVPDLAPRTVTSLKREWTKEFEDWRLCDLGQRMYEYFWMDGVMLRPQLASERVGLLTVFGLDNSGNVHLVALGIGDPKSEEDWLALFLDLKHRGLSNGPALAVGHGSLGACGALTTVFGSVRVQRCLIRETKHILNLLPPDNRERAKCHALAIRSAECKVDAEAAFDHLVDECNTSGSPVGTDLERIRKELLAFCDFPRRHWKHLSATAVIDSVFATVRLKRSRANLRLDSETAMVMAYQVCLSTGGNREPFGVVGTRR